MHVLSKSYPLLCSEYDCGSICRNFIELRLQICNLPFEVGNRLCLRSLAPGQTAKIGDKRLTCRTHELDILFCNMTKRTGDYRRFNRILHLLLVLEEIVHGAFEKLRDHPLHGIPIHGDQLLQEPDGLHLLAAIFFFHDDLCQHTMGDVIVRFGINNLEVDIFTSQFRQEVQCNIFGRMRIVEPPVRVFFDDDGAITISASCTCHSCSFHGC